MIRMGKSIRHKWVKIDEIVTNHSSKIVATLIRSTVPCFKPQGKRLHVLSSLDHLISYHRNDMRLLAK